MKKRMKVAVGAMGVVLFLPESPVYRALRPQEEIPELARLKAMAPSPRTRVVGGVAVHEYGGGHDRVVVLLHGALSDSAAWRFMVGPLAEEFDVVAVDLPGCGGSAMPGDFSPEAMGRAVLAALRGRGDARPATFVGHCYGGLVWLRVFSDPGLRAEFADVLDRVERLVLLAPVDVTRERAHPTFKAIVELPG